MVEGDRVRLRENVAKTLMRRRASGGHGRLDWTKRTGAVASVGSTYVNVKWDDRRSLDQWPLVALVVVEWKGAEP
jgi:hypothetical protein